MHDPQVPETVEGWSILHQVFRLRWPAWRAQERRRRDEIAEEAAASLAAIEQAADGPTFATTLLGHKGDLMLVHFRRGFEALQAAEGHMARLPAADFFEPVTSFVSVVELGMYEMTAQIHARLSDRGLVNGDDDFEAAFEAEMESQRQRVMGRLYPMPPHRRYVCFYPMNKRRGEIKNWYATPFADRARMMRDHGRIGRRYAGQVTQIISGAIGFDDWEWGVDLFADDPVVFKKLIYEMRFDEASAWFAEFGPFYVGLRFSAQNLPRMLEGTVPALDAL
jgi:peroxiredoxin